MVVLISYKSPMMVGSYVVERSYDGWLLRCIKVLTCLLLRCFPTNQITLSKRCDNGTCSFQQRINITF
jgi:hypothetical protein